MKPPAHQLLRRGRWLRSVPSSGRLWLCLLLLAGLTQLPAYAGSEPFGDAQANAAARRGPEAVSAAPGQTLQTLTNTSQLRQLTVGAQRVLYPVRWEGIVCAVNPEQGVLFLQDESGVTRINLNLKGQSVEPGARVLVTGKGVVAGMDLHLGAVPLVDNDGAHAMIERSGVAYLPAGRHPIRVVWFNSGTLNNGTAFGLEAYFQGPDLPRQRIPDSALSREQVDSSSGATNWVAGLNYRYYEGTNWIRLPDFNQLRSVKSGTVTNFNLSVLRRTNDVGLEFTGFLEAPRAGLYTLATISDDGSRLYVGETPGTLEVVAPGPPPVPRPVVISRALSEEEDQQWSAVEGTVTFLTELSDGYELELTSGAGRMRVRVAGSSGSAPPFLLNSQVRATGICRSTFTSEGQKVAGALMVAGWRQIELTQVAAEHWAAAPLVSVASLWSTNNPAQTTEAIVRVQGKFNRAASAAPWMIEDDTGQMPVEGIQVPPESAGVRVELIGKLKHEGATSVLRNGFHRPLIEIASTNGTATALPLLTSAKQIHYLSRVEAARAYPVRIRGVVISTVTWRNSFVLQDATRGIFVRGLPEGKPPQVGDFREVEGVTDAGDFAPTVLAERITYQGVGRMPDPIHPNRDQIVNGSLDAQYVELQGIVTAIEPNGVTLLMLAGKYRVELPNIDPKTLIRFENALVRIKGCFITAWDAQTKQIRIGQIRVFNSSFNVDEPAPADLFSAPEKTAAELLLFDAKASALTRIKTAGQIVHERAGEYYLMNGTNGLRFFLKSPVPLTLGEQVEVVGFPELGGASPVLREAMARKTGTAPLPAAEHLTTTNLLSADHDATVVSIEAQLVAFHTNQTEQVLELQAGRRTFVARLDLADGLMTPTPPGSRLQLTGVYAGKGGDRAEGRDIDSFELLLNSPADVKVLQRPDWWTPQRVLMIVAALLGILLLAVTWITGLRRQVNQRTHQLKDEIEQRKQTQHELEDKKTSLESEIEERKRMELEVKHVHRQLLETSRQAGMAEVATSVLHNVGNVLNSVNTSADLIADQLRTSKVSGVARLTELLEQHQGNLAGFLAEPGRADQIIVYLKTLAQHLGAEQSSALGEVDALTKHVQHIKDIVAAQQSYARVSGVTETVQPTELVEDALHMNAGALALHAVHVVREYDPQLPDITVEKHKALQILVNLIRNAKHACQDSGLPDRQLVLRVQNGGGRVSIVIADNGVGIAPENLTRIFNHGFTTRKYGHGFGLHSGANAARELGGSLTARSDGPGLGATFTLELPCRTPEKSHE